MKSYLDEFSDRGHKVDKAENYREALLKLGEGGTYECIIIDLSLPTESVGNSSKTKGGLITGLVVLEKMLANQNLNSAKKVIFTIANNIEVKKFCGARNVPYLEKEVYVSSEAFVDEIEKIVRQQ
jgi:CheY-like chemotaxis protein